MKNFKFYVDSKYKFKRKDRETGQKSGVVGPNCGWDPVPRSNISRDSHKHKWHAVWISKNTNFSKRLRTLTTEKPKWNPRKWKQITNTKYTNRVWCINHFPRRCVLSWKKVNSSFAIFDSGFVWFLRVVLPFMGWDHLIHRLRLASSQMNFTTLQLYYTRVS